MDAGDEELGHRNAANIEMQSGGRAPPSLISRLSFRGNQQRGANYTDPNFNEEALESPLAATPGKPYHDLDRADSSEAILTANDSNEELRIKAYLRKQYHRLGRLNPIEHVRHFIFHYLHPDEEAMQMQEESTRRKLMSPSIRKLDVFDRLRAVYKVPPGNKMYDTTTPYSLLFRMEGNVLRLVLRRIDFWVLLVIHIVVNAKYLGAGGTRTPPDLGPNQGPARDTDWPRISASMLAIPGMLLTFLLVFYNSQSFSRFMQQYWHTQRQLGAIAEFTLLLRTYVPDDLFPDAKSLRTEMWKLVHATHLLGFTGLPQQRAQDIDRWSWLYAHEKHLLTSEQIGRLKPLLSIGAGNQPFKETLTWVLQRVWELQKAKYISSQAAVLMNEALWRLRANIDVLYGMVFQPIPFAYFHLANSILIGYLFVLSYAFVFISPYYSIIGYILILFTFLGLRELSSVLADPFGNDDTDLPIFEYVNNMLKNMAALIDLPPTAELDHQPIPPNAARCGYAGEGKTSTYYAENKIISPKLNVVSRLDSGKNIV